MKLLNRNSQSRRRVVLIIIGFISFIWFLIRVIPKPSRATYPCQRAAFPFATSFIIWLTGTFASVFSFRKAKKHMLKSKYTTATLLTWSAIITFIIAWFIAPQFDVMAESMGYQQLVELTPKLINQKMDTTENLSTPLSFVSIVKSDKENSSEIEYDEIESMIREAVNKTDDFENLLSDSITVVIKPNIVSNTDWSKSSSQVPAENNGMVTDWRVIKAVIKLVREYNPNGKVYVIEGSADNTTRGNMATLNYSLENFPGLTDIIYLEENSGDWEEWDSDKLVKVEAPASKVLYADNLKPNKTSEFYMNKIYYESDVLISVPVLKNHSMTSVTGAVKNVGIGATPQNIYGGRKGDNHRYVNNRIDHSNYTNLHKFIHDFYLCRPVDYAIMEGLQGNENGPVAEKATNLASIQKNMRLILAGKDPLAVDAIASLIMRYNPSKVKHLAYLHNDTVGCIDPKYIRVLGPDIDTICKSFSHFAETSPKFNDVTPPEATIEKSMILNNLLQMSINSNEPDDILKIEIVIDDQKYKQDVVDGFENIEIDISELTLVDSIVKVKIYDKYLNCNTIEYKGGITTGTKKLYENSLKIFPNPVNDRFTVIIGENLIDKVEIYDLSGKLIQNAKTTGNEVVVNRKSISIGNYFVKVYTNNTCHTKQIMFN